MLPERYVENGVSFNPDYFYLIAHEAEITAGSYVILEHYGFATLADVKDYIINNDSTYYSYESSLP